MNLLTLKDFDRLFVGFDEQFNRIAKIHDDLTKNIANYPPYNIKKTGDNTYVIEIAVAGFSKSEIEITVEQDRLIVKGSTKDANDGYLFKGIAMRDFVRTFALSDQVEVRGAGLFNGMLKIALERIIPEHKKPKKIDISDEPSTVSEFAAMNPPPAPQLLVEDEQQTDSKPKPKSNSKQ